MNALNAYNKLNANVAGLKKSSEKLSSGYRINRAGDDAAGLAISEKMRSQIRGLNQAVRNSQDGINMIQTYEGAAQETHSILQRMKELAEESATGTYQNEVDRDAMQLEFNQLNDELDQIADTDFNGTVMLNGGQMADGLNAVNGKFDYANYTRDPGQLDMSFVNKIDYSTLDDTAADATNGNTKADEWWGALNSAWKRGDDSKDNDGPDYIDFTFSYDRASGAWTMTSNSAGVTAGVAVKDLGNGGFSFGKDTDNQYVNVVLDETQLMNGDTIVVRVNNPAANTAKPGNIGVSQTRTSGSLNEGNDTNALKDQNANLKTTVTVKDGSVMTKEMGSLIDALNGATFSANYSSAKKNTADDFSLVLSDGTSVDNSSGATITLKDGTSVTVTKTDLAKGKLELKVTDGTNEMTITLEATAQEKDPANSKTLSSGKITYTLGVEHGEFDASQLPTAEVVNPSSGSVSKSNAFTQATAPLTYTDHLILQTGARTKDSVDFTFAYETDGMGDLKSNLDISSRANGLNTKNLSLLTQSDANFAIDKIDNAINKVSMVRATFGATQNRLEHKITNLTTTSENLTEAESAIRDTDMASEMMNYTKFNILQQAAQSMLAQANQQPQSILQLLG